MNLGISLICYHRSSKYFIKTKKNEWKKIKKLYFEYGTWYSNVNQVSRFRYNNLITCRSSITDSPMQSCSDNRYQSTETQHRSKSHISFWTVIGFFYTKKLTRNNIAIHVYCMQENNRPLFSFRPRCQWANLWLRKFQ